MGSEMCIRDRPAEIHPTFALDPEDLPADVAARIPAEGPVYLE